MKRTILVGAVSVMLAGCSFQTQVAPRNEPPPQPAPIPPGAPSAITPKPVAPVTQLPPTPLPSGGAVGPANGYFELKKDGRMYVVADIATLQKIANGEPVSNLVTKEHAGPNGETVVVESGEPGLESRLLTEYAKYHPKKE